MNSNNNASPKQQSRFSRPTQNKLLTGKSVNGDQKNSLAGASNRFLVSMRNRKAAPKGK